jgi:hypothetical protein
LYPNYTPQRKPSFSWINPRFVLVKPFIFVGSSHVKLPMNSRRLGLDISDAGTAAGAPGAGAGAGVRGPGKPRHSKTMSDVYLSTYLDFFHLYLHIDV